MEERARLTAVEEDQTITKENHAEFWFQYQQAILLALKDEGILNEVQYRYAEEKLKIQFHTLVKQKHSRSNQREGGKAL